MESCLRLRLKFKNDDGGILSETQESQGLNNSWILLQQRHQLHTIADLSAYIIKTFDLHQSCPHGLLLSMDGFVLPPFELVCILKDKDIISVKKKGGVLLIEGDDAVDNVENLQIGEKQPATCGALCLANDDDDDGEEEEEGNNSDDNENLEGRNAISKKRKASEELQDSKKKKQRGEPHRIIEKKCHTERIENSRQGVLSWKKSAAEKEKFSIHENATAVQNKAETAKKSNGNIEATPSLKRNEQLQEDGKDNGDATPVPETIQKRPSRSARRQYAKRRWLREMAKIQKKDLDTSLKEVQNWKQEGSKAQKRVEVGQPRGLLHWKKFGQNDIPETSGKNERNNKKGIIHRRPIQNGDMVDGAIPVKARRGHIRFEPLEEDQAEEQSQVSVETPQWNGITNKKNGQKWGTNSSSASQRNNHWEVKDYAVNIRRDTHPSEPIDFNKLPPLPNVPEKGDVIAYRVIELSSSWTPEISSYRVGKVLWYNSRSRKVRLMPVEESPIDSDQSNEYESGWRPANGVLEVDFKSLLDVRIVKNGNSETAKTVPDTASVGLFSNEGSVTSVLPSNNKQTSAPIPEAGGDNHSKSGHARTEESGVNLWDQFSEALNAKKEELSRENGWGKVSPGSCSWSFRASKGSAVGPTLASFRSKKRDRR